MKRTNRAKLLKLYETLREHFGHRHWWPGDTPLEICLGAILTQNTSWSNVEKALENLKVSNVFTLKKIHAISTANLAKLIIPAGYFNVKAKRLKNFVTHIAERHDGKLDSLFQKKIPWLREELLSINGIGRETADSIILYAARKPIFVIDAYTKRVLSRHQYISEKIEYDELQQIFHKHLPRNRKLFNDFHAQFVAVGNRFCKPKPRCEACPLRRF